MAARGPDYFGDSAGGREVRPYTGFTATTRTPIINSFVDVKYFVFADGDERRYMGTSTAKPGSERPRARDFARKATLHDDEVLWVRALVDNNASPVDDCTDPQGVAVAQNTRLRVTVWSSKDGKTHVIRSWISASNSRPHWVTDAVLIRSTADAKLVLDLARSSLYEQEPTSAKHVLTADVLEGGGMALGTDGRVGSCWDNRVLALMVFRQE